jgi:hypothetical protein
MTYVMLLRSRVYNSDDIDLGILEKLRIFDMALRFVEAYRELLKLASTPLPFPMVQMGRTCLFLWVFTMPFVLVGVVANLLSVCVFLFFLTYGFVGMELVAMHLLDPFGDNVNDLGVDTMTEVRMDSLSSLQTDANPYVLPLRRRPLCNAFAMTLILPNTSISTTNTRHRRRNNLFHRMLFWRAVIRNTLAEWINPHTNHRLYFLVVSALYTAVLNGKNHERHY